MVGETESRRTAAFFVGGVTLALITLLCTVILFNNAGDALTFAFIGTRFSEGDPEGTTGYDGQFAYFIARYGADAVPYIDGPTLRYQRILYPLAARVLSLGIPEVVPWALIAINVLAHSLGAALIACLLAGFRAQPLAAFIYSVWIGCLFAIRFDLNEPLCFALALTAVMLYLQARDRWAIFLLILSTLTKELGLVIAAGLALHAASQGKWRWASLILGGPAIAFLAWWGVMRLWFGRLPLGYPAAKIHLIPLEGLFTVASGAEFILLALWLGLPAVGLLAAAVFTIWRRRHVPVTAALMIAAAGFVLTMPDVSWQDQVAAYRVGLPVVVAGILFVGQCYPQQLRWLAALWTPALLIFLLLPKLWLGA